MGDSVFQGKQFDCVFFFCEWDHLYEGIDTASGQE